MVPPAQMRALWAQVQQGRGGPGAAAASELLEVPGAHHMDAYDVSPALYWPTLARFVDQAAVPGVVGR
jgi:fermentation-respiration switch protein FrsA (DUF1100 family)